MISVMLRCHFWVSHLKGQAQSEGLEVKSGTLTPVEPQRIAKIWKHPQIWSKFKWKNMYFFVSYDVLGVEKNC